MSDLEEALAIMQEHERQDNLVQGTWLEGGKGCFYGCAMQTTEGAIEKFCEKYGMPLWLGHWSERVFEGLESDLAKKWPVELLKALIDFKGDLEIVKHKLAVKRLSYLAERNDNNEAKTAIEGVIKYHERAIRDEAAESEAESVADSAAQVARLVWPVAKSAAQAARSATWSAWSAEPVESVAQSATWSAWSAELVESVVQSAEEAAAWNRERQWMLEILRGGE